MSAGLLKGLGAGLATAGDFMMRTKADELKEERLRKYQMEAEARQNAREDTKEADKLAREEKAKVSATEYVEEEGKRFKVAKNADGVEIAREEVLPEKSKGFAASRWGILNKDTGEFTQIAGASSSGSEKMPEADKKAHDLFKTLAGKDVRTDEEEALYQRLGAKLGYSDSPQETGNTDAAFLEAFQNKARTAKLDAAMVSTKDREPFNEFPGSLSDQVQKGPGLLQKAGEALSNFTKNQSAREVEGAKVFLDMVGRQISEGNANRSMVENLNSIYTNDALPPELRRKALELYKKANER